MDIRILSIVLMAGLAVALAGGYRAYDDDDDDDDDYQFMAQTMYQPRRSRPMGFRRGSVGARGSMSMGMGRQGRYGMGPSPYSRRQLQNYALSFGGRSRYKGSGDLGADANIIGQRGGFKTGASQEGAGEGGARWDSRAITGGVRGTSKGTGTGAVMADTWVGGGSGKYGASHDVGGETGVSWDNGEDDPGMNGQSYLGNYQDSGPQRVTVVKKKHILKSPEDDD